jgi:uncharacterized protein
VTEPRIELKKYLDTDDDFRKIFDYTKLRFQAATQLSAHNWEHAYRDVVNAIMIGQVEKADMTIVLPAAAMHDIGFLYGAVSHTHGAVGAEKLPQFLQEGGISLSPKKLAHISECIRTHKGNIHGEVPQSLEAKVVSDADVLDKLGPVGVYQVTRAWTEFNASYRKTVEMLGLKDRQMSTGAGERLAAERRSYNQEYVRALAEAYQPYLEEQS